MPSLTNPKQRPSVVEHYDLAADAQGRVVRQKFSSLRPLKRQLSVGATRVDFADQNFFPYLEDAG